MKLQAKKVVFVWLLLLFCLAFQAENARANVSASWFYRADRHVVYGVEAYKMAETTTTESKYDTRTLYSEQFSISYGVRVWVVHGSSQIELTQGTPVAVVTRFNIGSGLQNASWNCPGYNGIVDAVMIRVYQRFYTYSWSLRVTFITSPELLIKFSSSSWIFSYFTEMRVEGSEVTMSSFYWGGNYGSGVTVQYDLPEAYEVQMWKLTNGDVIGWLVTPYTWFIGFAAYSLIFLLPIGLILYNRFEDAAAVIIGLLLIGGMTGGILSAVVPQTGLQLCWVLFVLGLAALLYKLFKSL